MMRFSRSRNNLLRARNIGYVSRLRWVSCGLSGFLIYTFCDSRDTISFAIVAELIVIIHLLTLDIGGVRHTYGFTLCKMWIRGTRPLRLSTMT